MKERANAALSNIERNAYAMSILRSRLESRINQILRDPNKVEGYQELNRVLELVKNGEMILGEMSEKIESARFLEEFVIIMDSAASSIGEIKGDLEQMVPAAEAALEEMHDAIARASTGLQTNHEIEPEILAEVTSAIAASKVVPLVIEVQKQIQTGEKKEEAEPEPLTA